MSIDDDRIEKLKRKLYSRTEKPVLDVRSEIKPEETDVKNSWGDNSILTIPEDMDMNKITHPILKKFLFTAVFFFILSLAFSAYIFFGGGNLVSSNNVDIKVVGPSSVASGEEIDLSVSLINKNQADLNLVQYTIDYPDGAMADKDSITPLKHSKESVDTIAKGSLADRTVKLFLFGDKGTIKTLKFKLEYQISGSNAVFTKEKNYDIILGSSPIIFNVSVPQEVNSGQEINFTVNLSSNSLSLLKNMIVSTDYPYGFTYDSSSMKPVSGNNIWNIGDLKNGDIKTLSVSGKLVAQDGEQRTFRFYVGTKSAGTSKNIDTIMSQAQSTITVSKPSISANLSLSGDTSDIIATAVGTNVNGSLNFTNTLLDQLNDVSVRMKISGPALDKASVQVGNGGFYQSTDGTIIWDKNSTPAFSQINGGESGNLSFSFNTVRPPTGTKNSFITISVLVTGTRSSSLGSVGQVEAIIEKSIKISANLSLMAKTLRGGPIANSGPTVPKAENASTYTADWILSNIWNDVSSAKVMTQLPPYVEWTGVISPSTANITYNSDTRTVTWSPDSVSAGAGFNLPPKEVFFQLKIIPSLSQVGSAPQLTGNISVTANDTFTGKIISLTSPALTTQVSDSSGQGYVTK